ncbi:LysE family transporter [Jannaschia sp. Os4]|uniref:LysE family translocator n=1 Tax=Jannaschia sp. Os4 TaxID=2807617 RepID=UPI00193A15EC|nr:LysE family transporter [Jannaschia sp. Os4]MBM2577200.1 LysE family transporter [Jannaschia sp. Os4]
MDVLLIGLATFSVVCATPGPAILTVIGTAMAQGLGTALRLSLGLSLALGLWGVLAAAGFGALLAAAPTALAVLKAGGGVYLLWLAWSAGRAALRVRAGTAAGGGGFRAGLLLNLSNPKSVFAWTAAIAVGTPPEAPALAWLLVPMATVAAVAINGTYAVVFSRPAFRTAYARARRWLDGIAATVFAAFGAGLLSEGLRR